MTVVGWLQIAIVLALVVAAAIPLSGLIDAVYAGRPTSFRPCFARSSAASTGSPASTRRASRAGSPTRSRCWPSRSPASSSLYALQRLQNLLPLNPQGFDAVRAGPRLQHRDQLHHQHQLAELRRRDDDEPSHADARPHRAQFPLRRDRPRHGLRAGARPSRAPRPTTRRQFLGRSDPHHPLHPAADRRSSSRSCCVALGVPQTLSGSVDATTLEGAKQTIAIGPIASQEAIKELGTNGGGFFNANSAHPFENPNAWSNLLEIWALLLIPVASVLAFGRVVGDVRQGRAILAAMARPARRRRRRRLLRPRPTAIRPDRARRRPVGRQHGRQGGPLRPGDDARCSRPRPPAPAPARVNAMHDSLHAARRPRADVQPARRLHLAGRRRLRASTASWSSRSSRCSSPG